MKTVKLGTHNIHLPAAPFGEDQDQRPAVSESFYRLLNQAQPAIGKKLEIDRDSHLSAVGQAEKIASLKPAAMDALGQSAQNLMEGKNNLARLEDELSALEPEAAPTNNDLQRAAEIRACWRDLPEKEKLAMGKAALDTPRDFEAVLIALNATPWPLDLKGGAGEMIEAATHKLAKLRNPEQFERVGLLRNSIQWTERAVSQVAAVLKADLRITDEDLLAHFIGKNDNATLEAMGFDAVTIGQTRVRLRASA